MAKKPKLVRIVRGQTRVLRRARYPLRGSKYANHLYTDHQHVVLLALRKVRPAELPVKLVVADKGYDAESNHEFAREVLRARTMIPLRSR